MYGMQVCDIEGTMKSLNMHSLVRHIQQVDVVWNYTSRSEFVVELEFSLAGNSKYALIETPFVDIDRAASFSGEHVAKVFYKLSGNKLHFSLSAISSNYFYAIKHTDFTRIYIRKLVIEYV